MILPLEYNGQLISITNWWGVYSIMFFIGLIAVALVSAHYVEKHED